MPKFAKQVLDRGPGVGQRIEHLSGWSLSRRESIGHGSMTEQREGWNVKGRGSDQGYSRREKGRYRKSVP